MVASTCRNQTVFCTNLRGTLIRVLHSRTYYLAETKCDESQLN